MSEAKNVTYGKPKVGGAVYVAPVGTTLPTDAVSELDPTFKSLGYISEDGITNTNSMESEKIKAWGGDVVLVANTGKEDTFTYTLIEGMNVDVLKYIYGDENVTGTIEEGVTVKSGSKPIESNAIVIDMILKGGVLKRIVIGDGTISELGDITYVDNDAAGYEVTIDCVPFDDKGNTHIEYIQKPKVSEG